MVATPAFDIPTPDIRTPGRWIALAIGVSTVFALLVALAIGLADAAAENGAVERAQNAVLVAASGLFLTLTLTSLRSAGAPAFALVATLLGLFCLREFEAFDPTALQAFLASHAARWSWAGFMAVVVAIAAWRGRRHGPRSHLRALRPVAPALGLAVFLIVLGAIAEDLISQSTQSRLLQDGLLWAEEALELCGYAVALVAGLWMFAGPVSRATDATTVEPAPGSR